MNICLLKENRYSDIKNFIEANHEKMYISDQIQDKFNYFTNTELRFLLFSGRVLCLANVENGTIIDIALLLLPDDFYNLTISKFILFSINNDTFFEKMLIKLKTILAGCCIKKIVAFVNNNERLANFLLQNGFLEEYHLTTIIGNRVRMSLLI
ncbi:MAG: hypothetical protein IJA02_02695 [Clostridia bacterium]|nr:hypothetical protein [Clostridia bacterium]MBQ6873561.1 hypothetical protein [Clostridia bacterium]